MAHPTAADLGLALAFGGIFCGWGLCMAVFAKSIRDWTIRQITNPWYVAMTRAIGAVFVVAGAYAAWSIAIGETNSNPPTTSSWTTPGGMDLPLVRDATSAVRIARTLELAGKPNDTSIGSEAEWLANCEARLDRDTWVLANRKPAKGSAFAGCHGMKVVAWDGRFVGP